MALVLLLIIVLVTPIMLAMIVAFQFALAKMLLILLFALVEAHALLPTIVFVPQDTMVINAKISFALE